MKFTERKRLLFFGLPWTFTTYAVTNEYITINSGLLRHEENDAYMYKVVDVKLENSFLERIFGLGTIYCYGGDVTNPTLILRHIKHSKEIKNFILEASEDIRIRRRTLNTMDVAGVFDSGGLD